MHEALMHQAVCPSPLGDLRIATDGRGRLLRIDFPGQGKLANNAVADPGRCAHVAAQLAAWFAGELTEFTLELLPAGTPFQLAAWRALREIPFGRTASYQEQARRLGNPRAVRAVGAANGANPIPIVVPCHRVIGKDGALTGFGGGLAAKRWLLAHEARVLAARRGARA